MIREESSQEDLRVALENWEPVVELVLRAATHCLMVCEKKGKKIKGPDTFLGKDKNK